MLSEIHNSLQSLLYEQGPIDRHEVDICFEAPTRNWINSLTRPTINLFLFDLQENTELRQTNFPTTRSNDHVVRRMPPRRFDLRYMVSALATVIEDEHLLLWHTLRTLLKYSELPLDVLPQSLRSLELPFMTRVVKGEEGPRLLDIWSAFEAPPHPALLYVVTAPVDLDVPIEAPLIFTRTAGYNRVPSGYTKPEIDRARREFDRKSIRIGGVVRTKKGTPLTGAKVTIEGSAGEGSVTDSKGQFVLDVRDGTSGTVTLRVTHAGSTLKLETFEIPSDSYEIIVD